MSQIDRIAALTKIGSVFSSAPVNRQTLFAGRSEQLRDAITAVTQRGQHAVIFGERGVGKTSLANIVLEVFGDQVNKPACGPINCDETMTFSTLWHTVFREMHIHDGQTMSDLASSDVKPDDIRHLLQNISKTVIVLDEVDRISDRSVTVRLADALKNLSDHGVDTTIVLVGVADSVDVLISEHVSIERNLVQIPMPRMSEAELREIIEKGAKACAMLVEPEALERIITLSQGLPHYTHVLCLNAFQDAANRDFGCVTVEDVRTGTRRALKTATQSVISAYSKAVTSPRKDNLYAQVLLACALSPSDALGYFYAGGVRDPMSMIMGKPYDIPAFSQHLNGFCEVGRGPILKRVGEKRRYRFRFANPLMQPYVIMQGVTHGLIRQDQVPRRVT